MTAVPPLSPAALQIFKLFKTLPAEEQENVREALALAANEEWPLDMLNERQKRHEEGLDPVIPIEQAHDYIRTSLRRGERAGA